MSESSSMADSPYIDYSATPSLPDSKRLHPLEEYLHRKAVTEMAAQMEELATEGKTLTQEEYEKAFYTAMGQVQDALFQEGRMAYDVTHGVTYAVDDRAVISTHNNFFANNGLTKLVTVDSPQMLSQMQVIEEVRVYPLVEFVKRETLARSREYGFTQSEAFLAAPLFEEAEQEVVHTLLQEG